MATSEPNGELPTLTNLRDEEFLERAFRRLDEDIKSYVTNELKQKGWNFNGHIDGAEVTLNNQAEAMAIIITDKIVREGRKLLMVLREDYKKKVMELCAVKLDTLEAGNKDKYDTFLKKIEFDVGTTILQVTQKHQFEEQYEMKTMLTDLKEMKPFLKAGEGKSYLEALKTVASLEGLEKEIKPILEKTSNNVNNIAETVDDMKRRLISGEYGDGSPEEKEELLKKKNQEEDMHVDADMEGDRSRKKKPESSSDNSDSSEEGEESSEDEKRRRKTPRKRERSITKEERGRRRSTTDYDRSDMDQRPSTSSGKRPGKDDPKRVKKLKRQSEKPLKVTEVVRRLRMSGRDGQRKANLIESKIMLMVKDMEDQKTIYVQDRNQAGKYVNPKTDLPKLDITKVPKYYYSNTMKDYLKCDTYRKMKENEIYDENYDEATYGVVTPSSI